MCCCFGGLGFRTQKHCFSGSREVDLEPSTPTATVRNLNLGLTLLPYLQLDLRAGSPLPLLLLWVGAPRFTSLWFRVEPSPRPDRFIDQGLGLL